MATIICHHVVAQHVADGHPCAALDDHQEDQGPEEDAQRGVDTFPGKTKQVFGSTVLKAESSFFGTFFPWNV